MPYKQAISELEAWVWTQKLEALRRLKQDLPEVLSNIFARR